jgi:hypothetical protein
MRSSRTFVGASLVGLLIACGGSESSATGDDTVFTSDPDKTVVVGGAGSSGAQGSAGCVTLPSGECVEAKACKAGERRDVVVDSSGKVVGVVCYPAASAPPVVSSEGNVELDKNDNGGVVSIGDVAGNVAAAGNNVTVYGKGPDASIVRGNVTATGNNFALRGVTVKGNVSVSGGNNAVLVLCVVEGNVEITGNNNVIADCTVKGNIIIEGVNNVLVGNRVGGTIQVTDAKNSVCDGNVAWKDDNANGIYEASESAGPLTCRSKS